MHGSAALVCAALAADLAGGDLSAPGRLSLLVCALSQSALFTVSASYHSLPWNPSWKVRMQRIDHTTIFVKIAGTSMPILWIGTEGIERAALIAATWAITIAGGAYTLWAREFDTPGPLVLKVVQGALVLPAVARFAERAGEETATLLAVALVCYLIGLGVYVTKRPVLAPRVFSHHETFHVLTVVGSAATLGALLSAFVP